MPLGGVWTEPLLAVDRVRFVGEPVALVLTDSAYQGEDAAELVSVDYEQLPAVASIEAALAGETPALPGRGHERVRAGPAETSATTRSSTAARSSSRATSSTSGSPACRWRAGPRRRRG